MSYVDLVDDTIASLVTTPGPSGISVIRVSGGRALSTVRKFFRAIPEQPESHKIYFGDFRASDDEPIDEVLVSYFAKGRSFTGDEVIEISTHGGFAASNRVLTELLGSGLRGAERGEFSFRAFYNGKIDLVQAEGILALINSKNEPARAQAIKQLKGRLSTTLTDIEEGLISIMAQLEASIDFSTEDIEPHSLQEIRSSIGQVQLKCAKLLESFEKGKVLSNGVNVVLAGPPNVGKSSLYNSLLGQDRAIVTDIPGTTRDILETTYRDLGTPVQLVDTAGLRETVDVIEKMGIEKTRENLETADLIFFLMDINSYQEADLAPVQKLLDKTYFVFNKMDTVQNLQKEMLDARLFLKNSLDIHEESRGVFVSAKKNEGIQQLTEALEKLSYVDISKDESLITQYRHADHLKKTVHHLQKAYSLVHEDGSYDLIALEVQFSLKEILALLGKEYNDQVLDRVFQQFCIGK